MTFPRDILNLLKWSSHRDKLVDATVAYVNRGSPGDVSEFGGREIMGMDSQFIEIQKSEEELPSYIPYHRVLKIVSEGRVLFSREMRASERSKAKRKTKVRP